MIDTIECKWPVMYSLLLSACQLLDIFVQDISSFVGGGGVGRTLDFKWQLIIERVFWVWNFLFLDFLDTKIWIKSIFGGALIQVKICFDIQNKLKICRSACVSWLLNVLLIFCVTSFNAFWNFQGWEVRHGIFLGLVFGPGIFSGSEFYPHSIIPVNWNLEYHPIASSRFFLSATSESTGR